MSQSTPSDGTEDIDNDNNKNKGDDDYTLFFYKHQVYKHNQPEILVFLNTLLNTSQPQIFEIFLKNFLVLAFSKQKLV